FLEKGFDATTIRDICARSGVNQASIYDYIANKNDILRRLLNKLWFAQDVPTLA
ncbi:MAG TPA: TetR/AcrR family transcriptional regulator, partial [Alcanivorax sp.]|nr:TetR/AcrR family transcriptional regulator [Alcanivorax sp.]